MLERLLEIFNPVQRPSAWLLIVPALLLLLLIDPALVLTLLQWSLFAFVLVGFSVLVSMIVFPQIRLGDLVRQVNSPVSAAILAGSLLIFLGLLIFSMAFWAKA